MTGYYRWDPFIGLFLFILALGALFFFAIFKRKQYVIQEIEDRHVSIVVTKFLRYYWFWIFDPVFKIFLRAKFSPNKMTIISLVFTVIAAIVYASGFIVFGSLLLIVGATCDIIDGKLARALNVVSKRGDFLDSCLDRYSDILIFMAIMFLFRDDALSFFIVGLVLMSSAGVSYSKAKAESLGIKNDVGMMQRPERILVVSFFGIISPLIVYVISKIGFEYNPLIIFKAALLFLAVTTSYSAVLRLVNGYKLLS